MKHKFLLLASSLLWLTSLHAQNNIAIDETNFPDANFRTWLKKQSYGEDGVLTPQEIMSVKEMKPNNQKIKSLKGIEFFTELTSLWFNNNQVTELDVSANTKLKELRFPNNKIAQGVDISHLADLEYFNCIGNGVSSVDVSNNPKLVQLFVGQNPLLTSLDVSKNPVLNQLYFNNCSLTSIDLSNNLKLKRLGCINNHLVELDLSKQTGLEYLECQGNHLTSLDLSICPQLSLSNVTFQNQTKTVDLMPLDGEHKQLGMEIVPSWNGLDVAIEATFSELIADGKTRPAIREMEIGDKQYLVLSDVEYINADEDLYNKTVTYKQAVPLHESITGSLPAMNVTVTTYPYVMYINPATEDVFTTPAAPFYSGTIYLDYDAVVPENAEVYVATGMQLDKTGMITVGEKTTSGQLNLVKLTPAAGATHVVIPANTPVYVKSQDYTGLFAFSRNLNNEPLATVPAGNIFKGTLTAKTVEPLSVLTLSKGRRQSETGYTSESRVGFWRYTKTTVPAHRIYIDADDLNSLGNSSVRGMTFNFFESETEMLTALESLNADCLQQPTQNNAGWYTTSGLRLNGQPTEKGVYIRNGKKVVK